MTRDLAAMRACEAGERATDYVKEKEKQMDMNVGNTHLLQAGANAAVEMRSLEWRQISEAPRDGTVIEIRNSYGVAPWYGLFRWTDSRMQLQDGKIFEFKTKATWVKVGDDNSSVEDGSYLTWRPYRGNTANYVDPTGGAQNSAAYWRGAAAVKSGLPIGAFENTTRKNLKKHPSRKSWWRRILGISP